MSFVIRPANMDDLQPIYEMAKRTGGGFTNPARRVPNSPFFDSLMVWAVRNGMVGINLSYRVVPQSPWPAAAEDVGMVVRWVHDQIAARGHPA